MHMMRAMLLTVGQKVRIVETRPLSKLKRWRVVEVFNRSGKDMIQQETDLEVADNTGAKRVRCFKVLEDPARDMPVLEISSYARLKKPIRKEL